MLLHAWSLLKWSHASALQGKGSFDMLLRCKAPVHMLQHCKKSVHMLLPIVLTEEAWFMQCKILISDAGRYTNSGQPGSSDGYHPARMSKLGTQPAQPSAVPG